MRWRMTPSRRSIAIAAAPQPRPPLVGRLVARAALPGERHLRLAAPDDSPLVCALEIPRSRLCGCDSRIGDRGRLQLQLPARSRHRLGAAEEDANFTRDLPTSVLPLIMDAVDRASDPGLLRARAAAPGDATSRRRSRRRSRATSPISVRGPTPRHACFHDETGDPESDARPLRRRRSRRGSAALHAHFPAAPRFPVSMTFHSLPFVLFVAGRRLAIYWRLPHRGQNVAAARAPATCSTAGFIRGSSPSCSSRRRSTTGPGSGWRTTRSTGSAT